MNKSVKELKAEIGKKISVLKIEKQHEFLELLNEVVEVLILEHVVFEHKKVWTPPFYWTLEDLVEYAHYRLLGKKHSLSEVRASLKYFKYYNVT